MESIVSYPERGKGGHSNYRGNCSPLLIEDLLSHYKPANIADFMVGSGTTEDVAQAMGVPCSCYDLHRGFDLLNNDIRERPAMIFFHPPYWRIIPYAGVQYDALAVLNKYGIDPALSDLSRNQSWEAFLKELDYCTIKQYAALEKGGYMAILVGDIKQRRKLYSMILEMTKPGTIEQIVIKAQHNCVSDRTKYNGRPFIPIIHEYLLILRKDNALCFNFMMTQNREGDIRDLKIPSWKDVICSVIEDSGGPVSLKTLYQAIEGHKKTQQNRHWMEKIRQTLYINSHIFEQVGKSLWNLKSDVNTRGGSAA